MMHCTSANPVIRKAINDYMIKEIFHEMETCYDTDNVVYKVWGNEDAKLFHFAYRGNDSRKILANGGIDMLKELYPEYMMDEAQYDPDYDITLKIEQGNMPKTQKVKKTMDEET
jgi:hypothetical protein